MVEYKEIHANSIYALGLVLVGIIIELYIFCWLQELVFTLTSINLNSIFIQLTYIKWQFQVYSMM